MNFNGYALGLRISDYRGTQDRQPHGRPRRATSRASSWSPSSSWASPS
ncbi:MAG: hypothetical protein M0C28_41745 [Candidatus Moduliflexus flocculans]|nr:hypothetical protein [Candidatus Moduliflexus flocculans]